MKIKFFLCFLVLPFIISCDQLSDDQQEVKAIPLKASMQKRVQQDNDFSFDLFKKVLTESEEKNIFISPLSVSIALGMTWNGAAGNTKTEMETALKMSGMTVKDINEYYQILLTNLPKVDKSTQLNIANSIWYKQGYPVKSDFLKINTDYFNAEVSDLDFSDPKSLDIINNWCAKQTNDLIKEPLDEIRADAIMYLINAIYFKGIWTKQFDKKLTYDANFYAEDNITTQVKMMQQKDSFKYAEDENAQYLDLPYGNKAFSMTVILPKDKKTTTEVLNSIDTAKWNAIVNSSSQEVRVYLPKFKVQAKYLLNDALKSMGMAEAFTDRANFTGIADADLSISRVIHSTYCDVNEEGTEAAAVTIVEIRETSMPIDNTPVFNANRPFIFVIRENSTGIILFMGKMGEVEMYD
ncbi:MAG: hypothetical protein BGO29_10460 [Bacteroidales bacterium 36-12]|jgi:serpin B|nr:MAG: hypothetical protein BGO29_10460 [Bacteroidales bacterium 36-12]